jgi:hypothetical protein
MMHWIGDNVGLIVGTVVGIVGIVVALLIYRWQQNPKQLDYSMVNDLQLLSPHASEAGEALRVFYEDTVVRDPHIVTVQVRNTGKVAIVADDFVDPISITWKTARLIEGFPAGGSSRYIVGAMTMTEGTGPVNPEVALINPNEYFDVQLLLDGEPTDLQVTARFRDQSRPMQHREPSDLMVRGWQRVIVRYPGLLAMITGLVAAILITYLFSLLVKVLSHT